ncbi:MAG: hypothetical protein ACFB4J_02575 [Elainellaceae cyanobacterium]
MKGLLMESDDRDAQTWQDRYVEACSSLGLPRDLALSRARSLAEGLALIEAGEKFDLIVVSPGLPGLGPYSTEALEAIRKVAPDAAVQVYTETQSWALQQQIEFDPLASLAIKRPRVSERDTELEALIQEAYRRGKTAIRALDRQVLPLTESVSHLETDLDRVREDLSRATWELRAEAKEAAEKATQVQIGQSELESRIERLENKLRTLDGLRKDVDAIRRSLGLVVRVSAFCARRWRWLLGLAASGSAAPFVVEALRELLDGAP